MQTVSAFEAKAKVAELPSLPAHSQSNGKGRRGIARPAHKFLLRTPLGGWKIKDADDDLDAEVGKKFKKG